MNYKEILFRIARWIKKPRR